MRPAVNHDSGQPTMVVIADLTDIEDRMRPTLFWLITTTGLHRVFTCTRWLEDVGWTYNSNRRLQSLRRKAPVSHPTSKSNG